MRSTPVVIATAALSCSLGACASPQPPVVVPQSVRVIGVSGAGLRLAAVLTVKNPNSFPLLAQSVTGDLFVGSPPEKLGTGRASPAQSIPAQGSALVDSQVQIAWQDVTVLGRLMQQPSVAYSFRGQVTLGSKQLSVNLPFDLKGRLTREQLIAAGLRGLGG